MTTLLTNYDNPTEYTSFASTFSTTNCLNTDNSPFSAGIEKASYKGVFNDKFYLITNHLL
jgi:hypothetical protein